MALVERSDSVDKMTGQEAPFNILLQRLLKIQDWEVQLRDALGQRDLAASTEIIDGIVMFLAPMCGKKDAGDMLKLLDDVRHLANPVYGETFSPAENTEDYAEFASNQSLLMAKIRELWLMTGYARQSKGFLSLKAKDPSHALSGGY